MPGSKARVFTNKDSVEAQQATWHEPPSDPMSLTKEVRAANKLPSELASVEEQQAACNGPPSDPMSFNKEVNKLPSDLSSVEEQQATCHESP